MMLWDIVTIAFIVAAFIVRHETKIILARARVQGWQHFSFR
jgi:hypothetical protein